MFDQAKQEWENPAAYEARMEAVRELERRQDLFRRAFDAENYHLHQDKILGYAAAEMVQFLFGGEIIKGVAKGVGKGAEFMKKAQQGTKVVEEAAQVLRTTEQASNITEKVKNILKSGAKLIGNQAGKDPAIRTVTKEEAEKIIKQLMDAGAKKVANLRYAGTWYQLPGGKGFGIRTKSSLKSTHYGTMHTIDLEQLNLEIVKLKY